MTNRYYALPLFLLLSLPIHAQMKTGIESVYDAAIGIRAKIIQPKCLRCHLSPLQEGERDGAPTGVNFETFELAKQNGDKIIRNTITMGNM